MKKNISELTTQEILSYLNEERKLSRIDPNEDYTWDSDGDPWVCEVCGSEDVQQSRIEWFDVNNGRTASYFDDLSETYCGDCSEHNSFCRKSEYEAYLKEMSAEAEDINEDIEEEK